MFSGATGGRYTLYHATSLAAAVRIQDWGFRVPHTSSQKQHGALLGPGVYCTANMRKALQYCDGPEGGIIFQISVDLGRCKILKQNDPLMTTWQYHGFDSACAPTGPFGGSPEETCIKDPKRIKILQAIPGVTTKLEGAGYTIAGGKIVKRDGGGFGQPPAQSYAPHQAVVAAPKSAAAPKAAVKPAAALKEVKATVGAGSLPAASSSPSQPPPLSKGPSTIQNEKKILTAAKMATLRRF